MTGPTTRKNGTAARVRKFFTENPGEELTHADLQTKFGLTESQARGLVDYMLKTKELRSERVLRWNVEAKGNS